MQVPFQYSLHIQEKRGAKPSHREFLAQEGTDPRRTLAERLCADIPVGGRDTIGVQVMAYNTAFEKTRLAELAAFFPDLAAHLLAIKATMVDLMRPFASRAYYARELAGSYSIKAVLPALFPNDPDLDYAALPGIHNGGDAMTIFPILHPLPPAEIAATRNALLAYCRLDTLAMVKILEKLQKMCS
jgi:hypothetical protein